MAYLKPQSPLQDKKSGNYFYPLTTVDQVIMEDGSRLNSKLNINPSDWNQNDPNASDYIKNRTHWTEPEYETVVPLQTTTGQHPTIELGTFYNGDSFDFPEDAVFVIDGISYEVSNWYDDLGYVGEKAYGDSRLSSWVGGAYVNENSHPENVPFCALFTYYDENIGEVFWGGGSVYELCLDFPEDKEYTVEVKKRVGTVYHKLDVNYLPLDEMNTGPSLPEGGAAGQVLIKNSATDGDASWSTRLNAINHLGAVGVYSRDDIGTSPNFDDPGVNGLFEVRGNNETAGESGIKPYDSYLPMLNLKTPDNIAMLQLAGNNNIGFFIRGKQSGNVTMADTSWKRLWMEGDAVTGAVWNDYAECRESDCEEFGYVLMENGNDTLSKTTERLSHFAGISSDTWGFSQGETNKAKTPIAVAGRVLAYPYQDRNNYKPGDCVCAAPGGTVDIMTREEIINWPDRIVGTVSCVPQYEEWGGGEGADRNPVKVNDRIWIKVR